ncbi:hypothetical protein LTR62_008808 [Meristemomyces frigidus]|uniref:Uncharacterized protein n=1 Tax=Meristemomyces frigidus TaxID=1508187 RepID=A0AAN7THT3_9PEZI|nr:hypothetical protein LTR62_008808 [Meristemomyces frigidus]
MDEDWQDLALNHRRLPHGKSKKGGKASGRHGEAVFNPKQAITRYRLTTENVVANDHIPKASGGDQTAEIDAQFEIHGFTETPGGYVASLVNSEHTFRAAVFLAGSRKLLGEIIQAEDDKKSSEDDDDDDDGDAEDESEEDENEDPNEDDDETEELSELEKQDNHHNLRTRAFEKNSFRQPKFWFRYQAEITLRSSSTQRETIREQNGGYVVFATHECRRFSGTIDCRALGWKEVGIAGVREGRRGETRPLFAWGEFGMGEEDAGDEETVGEGGGQD